MSLFKQEALGYDAAMKNNRAAAEPLLLPKPQSLTRGAGAFRLPKKPELELGRDAVDLAEVLLPEWPQDQPEPVIAFLEEPGFFFQLGAPVKSPRLPESRQAFTLVVTPKGISARARTYPGLLYAWQALKQLIRQYGAAIPSVTIRDWPDLDWRVYHLDLKGTRRRFENMLAILPELAEFRINAIVAEYEDAVRLDRHPDIATPEALTPTQVRAYVAEAARFGITVIPLVQTLGHLQYLLSKPAYARLREEPSDPSEACSSHPDTWPLIRDFIDELIDMHPGVPYLHVGLDETARVGTCPRCLKILAGKPRINRYLDWVDKVSAYCLERGVTPILWGDIIAKELNPALARRLPREAIYGDWGYLETGALHFSLRRFKGGLISREWLKRPEGRIDLLPRLGFPGKARYFEDLESADRRLLAPFMRNPEAPQWVPSDAIPAAFTRFGLSLGVVSGIRVSFHGSLAPRFITGQLNTIQAAEACKKNKGLMLFGSSWSRGHSLARTNAHPELDWYGIATLGAAGWSRFGDSDLREFDRRFAFHFFGLPDGEIGDILFLHERTAPRADHMLENYMPVVIERLNALRPAVVRNRPRFDLLRTVCQAQQLQFRAQFALLEIEYFYTNWQRAAPAFRRRILADCRAVEKDINAAKPALVKCYAATILPRDAAELADAQLNYFRDVMLAMAGKMKA
jgi:hypothetical protein